MKQQGLEENSERLVEGSTILWIGSKTADNVLIYVPGEYWDRVSKATSLRVLTLQK